MNKTQLITSLFTLSLLSACGSSNIWESITGKRPAQVVSGGRRAPELNSQNKLTPIIPVVPPSNFPQNYDVSPTPQTQKDTIANPYDSYDKSGNNQNFAPKNSNNFEQQKILLSPQYTQEKPETGNFFTRLISGNKEPKIQSPANVDRNARKTFSGNSYFQLDQNATSAEVQKLSSVPATPTQFQDVKSSLQQNIEELKSDHSMATQAKTDLDREVATGVIPTDIQKDEIAPIVPLMPPQISKNTPQENSEAVPVASLPEIKIDTQIQNIETPISDTANEIKMSIPQEKPTISQLPSPEIIKNLRPSRYEERNKKLQNSSN